jgi:hypothetical protein
MTAAGLASKSNQIKSNLVASVPRTQVAAVKLEGGKEEEEA